MAKNRFPSRKSISFAEAYRQIKIKLDEDYPKVELINSITNTYVFNLEVLEAEDPIALEKVLMKELDHMYGFGITLTDESEVDTYLSEVEKLVADYERLRDEVKSKKGSGISFSAVYRDTEKFLQDLHGGSIDILGGRYSIEPIHVYEIAGDEEMKGQFDYILNGKKGSKYSADYTKDLKRYLSKLRSIELPSVYE